MHMHMPMPMPMPMHVLVHMRMRMHMHMHMAHHTCISQLHLTAASRVQRMRFYSTQAIYTY